jgi:hypothetical protein
VPLTGGKTADLFSEPGGGWVSKSDQRFKPDHVAVIIRMPVTQYSHGAVGLPGMQDATGPGQYNRLR